MCAPCHHVPLGAGWRTSAIRERHLPSRRRALFIGTAPERRMAVPRMTMIGGGAPRPWSWLAMLAVLAVAPALLVGAQDVTLQSGTDMTGRTHTGDVLIPEGATVELNGVGTVQGSFEVGTAAKLCAPPCLASWPHHARKLPPSALLS